jgi:hypothetical protein
VKRGTSERERGGEREGEREREREGEGEGEGEREREREQRVAMIQLNLVEPVCYTKNSTTVQRMKSLGKTKILPGTLPSTSIQVQ